LCFKAIGNIWNDAFNGIGPNRKQNKRSQYQDQTHQNQAHQQQSHSPNRHENKEKPIEKGEGEYVDFEDVS
ncbi:MAG: DUF4834 family protein, partial [Bacteroidaceae bacterium]